MTFCLSHTAAITCSTFCWTGSGQEEVLVSGALDGQIIAWDHTTGKDLCRIQPSASTVGATSDQGPGTELNAVLIKKLRSVQITVGPRVLAP